MKQFKIVWLILFVLIFVAGCAVQPVETELPVFHPANPQADSAPFIPPVNVFQSDESFAQTPPSPGSTMSLKQHEKPADKPMDHRKDPMIMETKPPDRPEMEKTGTGHKEHNQ